MRPYGWALIQYDWCPYKREIHQGWMLTAKRPCEDTSRQPSPGQGERPQWGTAGKEHEGTFMNNGFVLHLNRVVVTWVYTIAKVYQTVHLRPMQFYCI